MHRYNWIRPHQFNDGLPPAVAEENLTHYPGWIDHYRPSKALANRDHSFPPKPAQANALLVPLLAALDVPGIRFVYSRRTVVWHSNVSIPLTYNHTQTIEIAIIGNVAEKALHLILEWRRACLMAHRVSIETVTRSYAVFPWKQLSLHRCRLCE